MNEEVVWFVPITGTFAPKDGWAADPKDPFVQFMWRHRFGPILTSKGEAIYQWSGSIFGLWWQGIRGWEQCVPMLEEVMSTIPYHNRNVWAHSHGGQIAILLAASGFPIRSLTTIGTPRRHDITAETAVRNIGLWQHLYDPDRDWTATMPRSIGSLGDWIFDRERRFLIPSVENIGIKGMGHSGVLKDPALFDQLLIHGVLDRIRTFPG